MTDFTIQHSLPFMTAKLFSELTGLELGVVEAQMDRRILPVLRIGKRRVVNLEALPPMRRSGSTTPLSNTGINGGAA